MVTAAVSIPVSVGENTTVMVQWSPGAKVFGLLGQLSFSKKSRLLVPVTMMLVMLKGWSLMLVRMIVCGVLGMLRPWGPKSRLVGKTSGVNSNTVPLP